MLGFLTNWVGKLSSTVVQFIQIPVFLHFWSVPLYGEWMIVNSIPAYLSFSNAGFGSVAGNEMTMMVARDDRDGALRVFQSCWWLISFICTATIVLLSGTLYYLPVITSWVVVSILFKYIFSSDAGLANYLLHDVLHILPKYVGWLQDVPTALFVIGLLGVWKGVGWSMLIFLAALQSIPKEMREAAAVDGAGPIRSYTAIVIPMIAPVILFVMVLLVIGSFNVFISVYLMTAGGPVHQTEVLLSYMYHQAFDYLDFGFGAALSNLLAVLIVALSLLQIRFLRREVEY